MDLSALIEQLRSLVDQAKAMPLSSSVLINREELTGLVDQMQDELPEEIRQAKYVVRDREELLAKAKQQAEQMLARAHQEQLRLAEHEEVVRRAHGEAARILSEAQDQARHLRVEAEGYADERLAELETALRAALDVVTTTESTLAQGLAQAEHGRARLRVPFGSIDDPAAGAALTATPAAPFDEELRS